MRYAVDENKGIAYQLDYNKGAIEHRRHLRF
jgi:hypothetical protein